ncbi:type II secretion system F family protein [Lacticaseibacillus paracasei]|uniref:type II secretion system F family protein n=1 Tax=Lacticaseibacillus paracasei TaxID=1597 RepID=UPI001F61F735|nr:type II secretion system F family protein [Lacticaseibacillus paracasei]
MSMPLVIQERFCRQSAALIAAGFSLPDVFAYLRVSIPKYRRIWERIETDLASGIGLPEAVGHQALAPILFQQLQLAQVHGDLAKALAVAGDYLGLRVRNRQRIGQLLIYPLVLLGMLVTLQVVVVFGVLPALALPQSHLVHTQLMTMGGGLAAGLLIWLGWHRLTLAQRLQLLQRLPGVRGVMQVYYQFQFTAGAAHFLLAGAEIADFCRHLITVGGPLGDLGARIQQKIQQGAELADALHEAFVPPEVARLLTMGQTHHLVATGLKLFGEQLFVQLQQRLERLVNLVQPLLFLLIGGEILLVYLQILLPLYQSFGG